MGLLHLGRNFLSAAAFQYFCLFIRNKRKNDAAAFQEFLPQCNSIVYLPYIST